jgi:DNA repair protein RecN (Recombination protein N)
VELLFSANVGEVPRPLAKVASGGEASRLLLALRASLAGKDGLACEVLDEADAGVGGAVADVVGRLIRDVSAHRQVLCITHLPQVAAHADLHLKVEKLQRSGRTSSKVRPLDEAERSQELARMLSGVTVTREAVLAAQALLRSARKKPAPARPPRERTQPPANALAAAPA